MGSRVAIILALMIVLSSLAQPVVYSTDAGTSDIMSPIVPTEGIVVQNGDWELINTANFRNATIYLTGNLTVTGTAFLNFENTTLVMNITEDGQYWIIIEGEFMMTDLDGSSMTTHDRSQIISNNTLHRYMFWAVSTATINFTNSLIRDCGYNSGNNGLNIYTEDALLDGMTFQDNYCGMYVRSDGAEITNSTFIDNFRGLDVSFSNPTIENISISGSTSRGMNLYYSLSDVIDCRFDNNSIGIYVRNSEPNIINCQVVDSATAGIYNYYSSPLIQDSQLDNIMDMEAVTNSFPRFLNTSFNESRVSIGRGLFAHVGQYLDVHVQNLTGAPQSNMTVVVLDEEGNPASRGFIPEPDSDIELVFRENFLTQDGPINMGQHKIIAFKYDGNNITYGHNVTALSAGSQVIVEVDENPPNVNILDPGISITENINYTGAQIIALGDIMVSGGAALGLFNSSLMVYSGASRTINCASGSLNFQNSSISAIGTIKTLKPADVFVYADTGTQVDMINVNFRWIKELELRTDAGYLNGIEIHHATNSGLDIVSADPLIENIYIDWASRGINVYNSDLEIADVYVEHSRDYGIYISLSDVLFDNITINDSSKALYTYYSELAFDEFHSIDGEYGIYDTYSNLEFYSSIFENSSVTGIRQASGTFYMIDCHISSTGTGIYVQDTETWIQESTILGGAIGIEAVDCAPALLNSTLDNDIDVKAQRGSSAALVNCTLDTANVSVEPSAHVDIGNWVFIEVVNQTLDPVAGCNVSILDSMGEVAGSGRTDASGITNPLSYRQMRILWNDTKHYSFHEILAFNGNLQESISATLSPGEIIQLQAVPNAMGWLEWTSYRAIDSYELYSNKTIIAHDSASVINDGSLLLKNTTLWLYGGSNVNLQLDIQYGTFEMNNSQLRPIAVSAPLQPFRFWLTIRTNSNGEILNSEIDGLYQVTTYSSQFLFQNSIVKNNAYTGIHAEKASPVIESMTFERCYDGLWVDTGYAVISNSSFVECAENGFYALGGEPELYNCQAENNEYGFALALESDANIEKCMAANNSYGFHIANSLSTLTNATALDNQNSGFYCSNSYTVIRGAVSERNYHGMYLTYAWPDILDSKIMNNYYGVYAYYSGPYLQDCQVDFNTVGFYEIGKATGFTKDIFSSGLETDYATFVDGNADSHVSVELPARATVREANISIKGTEIGDDAIIADDKYQLGQAIYGDWLVFQDSSDGDWEIFAYNLSVDSDGDGIVNYLESPQLVNDPALVKITDDDTLQSDPAIFEDTIVWSDLVGMDYNINAYTFSNDTYWSVCADLDVQRKPVIYGDHIVWEDFRNGDYDIYMKNITDGEITRLSKSTRHDIGAQIHGDYVVWYSYSGSPGGDEFSDIYLFDIKAWKLVEITNDDPIQYEPFVQGNNIAWHDNRNVDWDIYSYNIGTGIEQRLTDGDEQSFTPNIYKDNVVYYHRDRTLDIWSVRMYNMSTGVQTILEKETNGDSRPVIFGSRVAWVNKTDSKYDIHVLDFNLGGYPQNVSVDIGEDSNLEFSLHGEMNQTKFLNGSQMIDAFNNLTNKMDGGNANIPISVEANGTGRIVLDIVNLEYDVSTYIKNTSITNSVQSGVRCSNAAPIFLNSTLEANTADFTLSSDSWPELINSTFNDSKLIFNDKLSNLTVKKYLHVDVRNLTGEPLEASIEIIDNNKTTINKSTEPDGTLRWSIVTDATYNITGFHDNSTTVNVSLLDYHFDMNPRDVDMSVSHWEFFVTDTVGPEISNVFPPPFWTTSQLRPEISANIISKNLGVDLSSVRLYVQSFAVFYDAAPVPGGYNISYTHPVDFPDGEIVHCQIYGEDTYGNIVDYSWEFLIDIRAEAMAVELLAGWNLVSIPFYQYNQSIDSVLSTIQGKYDLVRWYSSLNASNPWLSYSPDRPDAFNEVFQIDRKIGFWVRVTENCTLHTSGIPKDFTLIPLNAGWNLVGYTILDEERTVSNALWGTGADRVEGFDPSKPYLIRELKSTYIMRPGEGYWVHVPADTVWILDSTN